MAADPDRPGRIDTTVARAAAALSSAWGGSVTLRLQDPIRTAWGRHTLLLCRVKAAPDAAPATVVIKMANDRNGAIFNEWAGLEFLGTVESLAGLAPVLHAGDAAAELLVLEDLGGGPTLHRLLQSRRAWAEEALVESQTLVGRVHAATRGRANELDRIRSALPPCGPPPWTLDLEEQALAALVTDIAAVVGVDPGAGLATELREIAETLVLDPRDRCYTLLDVCPPNRLVGEGGMRLLDLEMGGFRHPLLDGAYSVVGALRCNDGLLIPEALQTRMLCAYRAALREGYPEFDRDDRFTGDLVCACAAWLLHLLRPVRAVLERDRVVGFFFITGRQRIRASLDAFVRFAGPAGQLPALCAWAAATHAALERRWPDVPSLPVYPPLR